MILCERMIICDGCCLCIGAYVAFDGMLSCFFPPRLCGRDWFGEFCVLFDVLLHDLLVLDVRSADVRFVLFCVCVYVFRWR